MILLEEVENVLKKNKKILREKYFVKRIGVFGSWLRGEQQPESDIDILVEIDGPIGWDFIELNEYLENLLGNKVDLISIKALKPQLKEEILSQVVYI